MRFNPAQEAELETYWEWLNTARFAKDDRFARLDLRNRLEGLRSADVDLQYGVRWDSVSKNEIGKWIHNRTARAKGVPRAQQKTPAQLAILEASFEDEVYPLPKEIMRIMALTSLSKTQVTSWFVTKRKRRVNDGRECWTRTGEGWTGMPPPPEVAKDWREWKEKSVEMTAAFIKAERAGLGEQSRVQCRRAGICRPFSFLPDL